MKIIIRQNGRSLSSPRPRPVCGVVVVAARSSLCPGRVRGCVRGLAEVTAGPKFWRVRVCGQFGAILRSQPVRVRVRDCGEWSIRCVSIPRLFRGHKILRWRRSRACLGLNMTEIGVIRLLKYFVPPVFNLRGDGLNLADLPDGL